MSGSWLGNRERFYLGPSVALLFGSNGVIYLYVWKKQLHSRKAFLIFLSSLKYFPRYSCIIPRIPAWLRQEEYRIPENFKENQKWDVQILTAPKCPPEAKIIRLIKTAPFNFDLRNQFLIISDNLYIYVL